MEVKIMDVLRKMQLILDEVQLRELKEVLQMTFAGCRVIQETDLQETMIFAGHAKSETTMRYCTVNQEGVRYHHFKYLSA